MFISYNLFVDLSAEGEARVKVGVVVDVAETPVPGIEGTCWARSSHAADFHPAPCVLQELLFCTSFLEKHGLHLPPFPSRLFFFSVKLLFSEVANNFPKAGDDRRLKLFQRQICIWHCTLLLICIQAESLTQQNMGKVLVWFICLQW